MPFAHDGVVRVAACAAGVMNAIAEDHSGDGARPATPLLRLIRQLPPTAFHGRNPSAAPHAGRARGWINVRVARDTLGAMPVNVYKPTWE
jgi:hypothetical protein